MCRCHSGRDCMDTSIGLVISGAVMSLLLAGIHFTYTWSVVDGQLHRGYYWVYLLLTCALVRLVLKWIAGMHAILFCHKRA